VVGKALDGAEVVVPEECAGDTNVLLLAFQQRQQRDIDQWIAALGEAGVATSPLTPGPVVLYELPLLGARWQPFRQVIDGGMAANIRVPEVLARTVTVYGQTGAIERALDLPTRDRVYAVVERDGEVLHIEPGWPADVGAVMQAAARSGTDDHKG
jgi:hypothetical protein